MTVIINKIEDFIDSYQKGDTSGSNALSREDIDSLRDELKVACTYGDEKVSLTIQTYELVCLLCLSISMISHLSALGG